MVGLGSWPYYLLHLPLLLAIAGRKKISSLCPIRLFSAFFLLAPSGALVFIMGYYIHTYKPAFFRFSEEAPRQPGKTGNTYFDIEYEEIKKCSTQRETIDRRGTRVSPRYLEL